MTSPAGLLALTGVDEARCAAVATLLVEQHGYAVVDLAAGRREALLALDPMLADDVSLAGLVARYGWATALADRRFGPEVVRLDAAYGAACRSLFGVGAWVDVAARAVLAHQDTYGDEALVLTGLSQPEEAKWVRAAGGLVWAVQGPGEAHVRVLPGIVPDVLVTDDATPDALARRVLRAVRSCAARGR